MMKKDKNDQKIKEINIILATVKQKQWNTKILTRQGCKDSHVTIKEMF